jgi:3-phosphoshikimate 1-carboxyvinyltransferase
MPLPDLIEIVPLSAPVHAEITVPGSKSITNRALVLAALADGEVTLTGALWSEDTQVMVDCLQRLGFEVRVELDANEFCNRTITVRGRGGEIPKAGTAEQPLELFVGNAGTAARFLSAMVCLGRGVYRLSGVPRMHERPQAALFSALRELGYRVDAAGDKLPTVIHGTGPRATKCRVSIEKSSQFASALLLGAERGGWQIEIVGENADESPYVVMTSEMIKVFPKRGGKFQIEPDASSGSYFLAADWVQWVAFRGSQGSQFGLDWIKVNGWPESDWQIDSRYRQLRMLNKETISRRVDIADSIMIAITIAPLNPSPALPQFVYPNPTGGRSLVASSPKPRVFTELGRLRVQECERVFALKTELQKCGAQVHEHGDTLTVFSNFTLHRPYNPDNSPGWIETYDDHRMAMCFAVLGLKVPGIKLRHPACVKKTFPNFFQKLAAAPPHGLGVEIRDGHTGRKLSHDELFAE